jgi:hypothetical protein
MRPLLCVAGLFLASAPLAAQERPAGIPVVKSWEDLQAVPAIDLGDGVKIRLGFEATKIPQWSGALLYCLTEGYVPTDEVKAIPGFGPVFVDFTYEGEKAVCCRLRAAATKERTKGQLLFVRAMPGARIGKFHVSVTDRRYKELAAADVVVTKDAFHAWTPWLEHGRKPAFPDEGIVLPSFPMAIPLVTIEAGKARTGRLPTFWPAEPDPKLTIKLDGDQVAVRSDAEFETTHFALHMMARWWINDKPYAPTKTESRLMQLSGLLSNEKEIQLDFDFRADRLRAKVGDKIGMQVMYSENYWAYCVEPSELEARAESADEIGKVQMSNRIDFVVRDRHLREVKSP